jgi:hypothetical protein
MRAARAPIGRRHWRLGEGGTSGRTYLHRCGRWRPRRPKSTPPRLSIVRSAEGKDRPCVAQPSGGFQARLACWYCGWRCNVPYQRRGIRPAVGAKPPKRPIALLIPQSWNTFGFALLPLAFAVCRLGAGRWGSRFQPPSRSRCQHRTRHPRPLLPWQPVYYP